MLSDVSKHFYQNRETKSSTPVNTRRVSVAMLYTLTACGFLAELIAVFYGLHKDLEERKHHRYALHAVDSV